MISEETLKQIPVRRIAPFDGMSITAEVWQEAHTFHHQQQLLHNALAHDAGILAGLRIIAADPPDDTVYILPGVAQDEDGNLIVVHEPITYDIERASGIVHILLSYDESKPQPDDTRVYEEGDPNFVVGRFSLEARARLPQSPYVELARVRRSSGTADIKNATDPEHPDRNEIDLRFRRQIQTNTPPVISMAICPVGDVNLDWAKAGIQNLGQALSYTEPYRLVVDTDLLLGEDFSPYDLIYLVGQEAFELDADQMQPIYNYLQQGGTLLIESVRRQSESPPADTSFADMLGSLGITLQPLSANHQLLHQPYLFAAPPDGFVPASPGSIQVGNGVVFSSLDFGSLWAGHRRGGGLPSRAQLRAALEWGANLVTLARARRNL